MEPYGDVLAPHGAGAERGGLLCQHSPCNLIHDFSDNSIRKIKTARADSLKIANYALTFWSDLRDYTFYYQRKRTVGKSHLSALGHVFRKMINIIFAVLRDNSPYFDFSLLSNLYSRSVFRLSKADIKDLYALDRHDHLNSGHDLSASRLTLD